MNEVIKNPNSSLTYYVNIEKGTVACVIEDVESELANYLTKIIRTGIGNRIYFRDLRETFDNIPHKISAYATCAEGDEFDLELGMKIARTKALKKLYKLITNCIIKVNDALEDTLETVEHQIMITAHKYNDYMELEKTFHAPEEEN